MLGEASVEHHRPQRREESCQYAESAGNPHLPLVAATDASPRLKTQACPLGVVGQQISSFAAFGCHAARIGPTARPATVPING